VTVTLKLFASLAAHLPQGARDHAVRMEVPEGTSIGTLLDRLGVPPEQRHLVLRNGVFVTPAERARPLRAGDVVAVWPPVAGG
jgi:molybdopterin converting factor small subunit